MTNTRTRTRAKKTVSPNGATPKIRLKIERARLTFGDFEDIIELQERLNETPPPLKELRRVLARFAVDENENYLDEIAANAAIRSIPFAEIGQVFADFGASIQQVTLPPVNSNG